MCRPDPRKWTKEFEWLHGTKADRYDVAIAGAGPADQARPFLGEARFSCLARRAENISRASLWRVYFTECLRHFEELGVSESNASAGGAELTQTVFYSRSGRSLSVPCEWFEAIQARLV